MRTILVVALVCMSAFTLMQAGVADIHIHGIVRDSVTRAPLIGATVRVANTTQGTVVGRGGVFHLHDVVGDTVRVVVSMIGYASKAIIVTGGVDRRVEVLLAPAAILSKAVTVEGEANAGMPAQHVEVLSQAHVDEHRGQTFADVLRTVPGVTIIQTGPSISKPMYHGMTGLRLVTLNAGVVQEGQQWGAEHAPEIDPFAPARIQVVAGPSAVMYGPNAIGGVISVEPRPLPTGNEAHGEVNINTFTNNWQGALGAWLEAGDVLGSGLAVRVQGSTRRAGDAATPAFRLTNSGFSELNGAVDLGLTIGDVEVVARASLFGTTLGIFSGSHVGNSTNLQRVIERGRPLSVTDAFSYDIGRPRQEIEHRLLSIQTTLNLHDAGTVKVVYGWQRNDRSEFDAHNSRIVGRGDDPVERARDSVARLNRALATPAMQLLLDTYSADARWTVDVGHDVRLTTGVAGQHQKNTRFGSVFLVPDYVANGLGGFAFAQMMVGDVALAAGVRYDVRTLQADVRARFATESVRHDRTFASGTASIGAAWEPSEHWLVRANVGTGWRPPHVNELFSNDVHHGTAVFEYGDSLLQSERSVGLDASVRYRQSDVEIYVTGYVNSFDGYILSVPDRNNPTVTVRGAFPTFRFTQTPATIAGADVRASWALSNALNLYGVTSIVRGTDVGRNQPLFMMPADRVRLGTHLHFHDAVGLHDPFLDVSVVAVDRQHRFEANFDYAAPPPGYALVDVSVGGIASIGNHDVRVSASVSNLFDTRYRDYLSRFRYMAYDVGRNITVRITVPF